jgi:uncharacterized cupredoxin-like copper-binding protein
MRRPLTIVTVVLAVVICGGALVAAQGTPPPNVTATPCASPVASPAASPAASPLASPVGQTRCAGTVAVTESDFRIEAAETTFKVGQAYTFIVTNAGKVEHELVIERRGVVDTPLDRAGAEAEAEDIAPGRSKPLTWTFTEPGAYQFGCHKPGHFEAGMVLTIDVLP